MAANGREQTENGVRGCKHGLVARDGKRGGLTQSYLAGRGVTGFEGYHGQPQQLMDVGERVRNGSCGSVTAIMGTVASNG